MRSAKVCVKRWKWGGPNSKWAIEGLRDENGKRIRKFFPSRDAADEWLMQRRPELRDQGRAALSLTDRQRVDAVRALAILSPYGASLTAAAEAFAERAELLSRTVSFAELRAEIVNAKRADKKSDVYVNDLIHRLAKAGETFDDLPVATIETREIDDWLRSLDLSPTSRHNYRKVLRTAFEFGVSRGYARQNPVVRTATVKVQYVTPGILTANEMAALLEAADQRIVPSLAIGAFAGLRDAEIGRMTWDRIDLVGGYIKVDASVAKTESRRIVPISDNLRAWLAPHAQRSGPVRLSFRVNYELTRKARAAAAKSLKEQQRPCINLDKWPNNALRHSFASYRMALVGNAATVAEECGHSVRVMREHYRELMAKPEAEAWFSVMPGRDYGNLIGFQKPA